jgi:hypothetical protein
MSSKDETISPFVGLRARFFHPMTFGVMYTGTVKKVLTNGMVLVKFDIDGKSYTTFPEFNERR